jgi:predicted nicotinamide N-methyase
VSALRFRYQTIEFDDIDIHVKTLRDNQQFNDDDGAASRLGIHSATWPISGIIWASGKVLAQLMSVIDIKGKSILEVGCGIGLASLVLNHRSADITATDHHPGSEALLSSNADLNDDGIIPFERTSWGDPLSRLGKFDLIIGSDLLYERGHAEMLSQFIDQHAKLHCEVIIVDPGRGYLGRFRKNMQSLGYQHDAIMLDKHSQHNEDYKGQALRFKR